MSHQIYETDSNPSQLKPERPGLVQNPTNATGVTLYNKSVPLYRRAWYRIRHIRRARALYIAVCLLVAGVWYILMVSFAQFEKNGLLRNTQLANNHVYKPAAFGASLIMQGTLRQFDAVKNTLTVNWALTLIGPDNTTTVPTGTDSDTTGEVGIYRDQLGVPLPLNVANFTIPDDNTTYPIYSVDNATAPVVGVVGLHPWDGFSTDIDFDRADTDSLTQQLSGYPFDRWTGQIVFVANSRADARAKGLNGSYVIELYDAQLVGSILNWRIKMTTEDTCEKIELPTCELRINFSAGRPALVKFAVIIAVIVNWSSTIFIVIMSCELTIVGRTSVIGPNELLAVCFTALFALPTVRSILPGVGEFGAFVDVVGIIPNVIIIAICTTMVSIVALKKKPDEEVPQPPQIVVQEKQV